MTADEKAEPKKPLSFTELRRQQFKAEKIVAKKKFRRNAIATIILTFLAFLFGGPHCGLLFAITCGTVLMGVSIGRSPL